MMIYIIINFKFNTYFFFQISYMKRISISDNVQKNVKFVQIIDKSQYESTKKLNCYKKLEQKYKNKNALQKDQNQIPHNRKLLKNMLKRLQTRGQAFYRLGFRTYEKYNRLNFLEDILNLKKNQTSGTLNISQFWNSKNMMTYLKSNRMYLNKKQLLVELKLLEKQEEKIKNDPHLVTMNEVQTKIDLKTIRNNIENREVSQQIKKVNSKLSKISHQLSRLTYESINRANKDQQFQKLEKTAQNFNRIQRKYILKMIQLS